jgi:hypothetical protein
MRSTLLRSGTSSGRSKLSRYGSIEPGTPKRPLPVTDDREDHAAVIDALAHAAALVVETERNAASGLISRKMLRAASELRLTLSRLKLPAVEKALGPPKI